MLRICCSISAACHNEAAQRHGNQAVELACIYCGSVGGLAAKATFRSMNAAEMVQHRLQQMVAVRYPGVGSGDLKFHCIFKGSGAR
jgi:hypothetical protein